MLTTSWKDQPLNIFVYFVQLMVLAVLLFGDIGFDHPGRFGLSWGHGIAILALYIFTLLLGIPAALIDKSWKTALVEIATPLLVVVYFYWPAPHYHAQDYQYLIGKPKSEVEKILSSREVVHGYQGRPDGDHEFAHYKGMSLHYGVDGKVKQVLHDDSP